MTKTRSAHRPYRFTRRTPPGAPPGTLSADPLALPTALRAIRFDAATIDESERVNPSDISQPGPGQPIVWLDIIGLSDIETVRQVGKAFGLHELTLEDIVNVHQRPKLEDYGDYLYITLRMPGSGTPVSTEQVSLILGESFVITFQERPGDCFDPLRARLRNHRGRLRERGADYLAYALIDAVTDAYFPQLEAQGERLEALEQEVFDAPASGQVADIHRLKRDLLTLRRAIWPLRELLNELVRDDHPRIGAPTQVFLRDCYDHTVQLMDMIDTNREMAGALIDLHMSSVSNRMNEVMKVLTVIATIFMPLGFIAGVYGMNFDTTVSPWNMPELGWRVGYPVVLGLMTAIAAVMLVSFWRRGWIGRPRGKR